MTDGTDMDKSNQNTFFKYLFEINICHCGATDSFVSL